jgi:hypothetical protein
MTRDEYIDSKVTGHIGDQGDYKSRLRGIYGEYFDNALKNGGSITASGLNNLSDSDKINGLVFKIIGGGTIENDGENESSNSVSVSVGDLVKYTESYGWELWK